MLKCAPGTQARALPNFAQYLGLKELKGTILEVKRQGDNGPQNIRRIRFDPNEFSRTPIEIDVWVGSIQQVQ